MANHSGPPLDLKGFIEGYMYAGMLTSFLKTDTKQQVLNSTTESWRSKPVETFHLHLLLSLGKLKLGLRCFFFCKNNSDLVKHRQVKTSNIISRRFGDFMTDTKLKNLIVAS